MDCGGWSSIPNSVGHTPCMYTSVAKFIFICNSGNVKKCKEENTCHLYSFHLVAGGRGVCSPDFCSVSSHIEADGNTLI